MYTRPVAGRTHADQQPGAIDSEQCVEIVRSVYAAHARGDMAAVFDSYQPDIEWQTLSIAPGAMAYRGHEGVRTFMRAWLGAWREWHIDVEEVSGLGADRVLTVFRQYGMMRDSEFEVEQRVAQIWTLREGRVARVQDFSSRAAAVESAAACG